jgi:site-specific recombinase XerD
MRLLAYLHLMTEQRAEGLRAVQRDGRWYLDGAGPADLQVINEFLGYVADRGYSPRTERAYAFDLLAFARWLVDQDLTVGEVTTDALLRFLTFCRAMVLPGQAGGNVVPLRTGRSTGYAPSTINRRMAAISGLFDFRAMRDPALVNPMPRSAAARRASAAQRGGLLAHLDRPKSRSRLRVREPRRLPRGLDRAETAALLGSFRSDRDRAIAGLMLFSGLRSAEVLGLQVRDVDIPRRWVRVVGKGDKERTVPVDVEVAGLVQTYLLAERPESASTALFLVAKGSHRGQPLTPAGLRTVFRYHRAVAGVPAGHPHALRHSFGTALAEAGVDLAVLQVLMGHDRVDSSAAYIHLAPTHVRASYDAARARQRADV